MIMTKLVKSTQVFPNRPVSEVFRDLPEQVITKDDVDLTKLILMSHDDTAGNVNNYVVVSKNEQAMVAEAEARDPNSVPNQPRYPHRGGGRRRRHQGENIFKPCGQQFRLFFPAQKCFENRCRALRTSSTTTALGAI